MSSCQVRVRAKGLQWDPKGTDKSKWLMLYHHTDGYPSHMLKMLLDGYQAAIAEREIVLNPAKPAHVYKYNDAWKAGRPGHAAAFIISAEPQVFEPESSLKLHPDIEYFYDVQASNETGGATGSVPRWKVTIYTPNKNFWDKPCLARMTARWSDDIVHLGAKAQEIEDRMNEEDNVAYEKEQKAKQA